LDLAHLAALTTLPSRMPFIVFLLPGQSAAWREIGARETGVNIRRERPPAQ